MCVFRAVAVFLLLFTVAPAAIAEENPLSGNSRFMYSKVQQIILGAAEKVPESEYSFKPTPEVRSFGQIVAHVADAQYLFCSINMGVKNPAPKFEATRKTKAEIVAALKDGFAYCDKSYEAFTDANAAEKVKFHGMDMTKLGVYAANTAHAMEHYGNLVTYMRIRNIIPPTSDPEFARQFAAK